MTQSTIKKILFTGIIMLFSIGKAASALPDESPFHQRSINVSGNIITFSMPENFSKDMPADDLITSFDIHMQTHFSDTHTATLMRRWWDYSEGRFFKKDLGSVMLTLNIIKSPNDTDVTQSGNLILAAEDLLHIEYDEHNKQAYENKQERLLYYLPIMEDFHQKKPGSVTWLRYTMREQLGNIRATYILPLDQRHWFEASFSIMPARNVNGRSFAMEYIDPLIQKVISSFSIQFAENSPAISFQNDTSEESLEKVKKELIEFRYNNPKQQYFLPYEGD
jgi:hypothetical protein